LDAGTLLADTAATSQAFRWLALSVETGGAKLDNTGDARFAAAAGDADVSSGIVAKDTVRLPVTGHDLTCGDGTALPPPAPSESPSSSDTAAPTDSTIPSATPSVIPSPSPAPSRRTVASPPPRRSPSPSPSTRRVSPSPTRSPTPTDAAPVITNAHPLTSPISQNPPAGYVCTGGKATQIREGVYADVSDADDATSTLKVSFTWKLDTDGTGGSGPMSLGDGIFAGGFTVDYAQSHMSGGTITITVRAVDPKGKAATPATFTVALDVCRISAVIG
jgi:hypothetical protein